VLVWTDVLYAKVKYGRKLSQSVGLSFVYDANMLFKVLLTRSTKPSVCEWNAVVRILSMFKFLYSVARQIVNRSNLNNFFVSIPIRLIQTLMDSSLMNDLIHVK
jgi:hypothetical protein